MGGLAVLKTVNQQLILNTPLLSVLMDQRFFHLLNLLKNKNTVF